MNLKLVQNVNYLLSHVCQCIANSVSLGELKIFKIIHESKTFSTCDLCLTHTALYTFNIDITIYTVCAENLSEVTND